MKKIQLRKALFQIPLLCCLIAAANADTGREQVIVVLDASGSMWGQIDGQAKIAIAKTVVRDLLTDWDPEVDLGLFAYGHRRKGDCQDIQSLVAVAPVRSGEIEAQLDKITPKGKTPLSQAVTLAAEQLKYTEQKATVILVSDGIETCDADPCEVASRLESSGVDFTAHVIGFDIKKQETREQLRCLAENTGGQFLTADDADSLNSAISLAVQEVTPTMDHNLSLSAVHAPGGEPLSRVAWQVKQAGIEVGRVVAFGHGATPDYSVPPGNYVAFVRSLGGKATAQREITVPQGESVAYEVVLAEEGVIKLIAVNQPGGESLEGVSWTVVTVASEVAKGRTVAFGHGAQPEYKLLPGQYIAKARSSKGKAEVSQLIEVQAGKRLVHELVIAEEGVVKMVAVNQPGGVPLDGVAWSIETLPDGISGKGKSVAFGHGSQPEYRLLPGKYLAKVRSSKGKARATQEIEVVAGQRRPVEVVLAAEGIIELTAVHTAGGQPLQRVAWTVKTQVPADSMEKPKTVSYGKGPQPEYLLLPGKYVASVRSLKGVAATEQEVEVVAGKRSAVELLLPEEGEVALSLKLADGTTVGKVYWEVNTLVPPESMNKPERVMYGKGATPTYRLLPGRYQAKAKFGNRPYTKEIEVKAGKKLSYELILPETE